MTSTTPSPPGIAHLPELIDALAPEQQALVTRLFQIVTSQGQIDPPDAMKPWLAKTFGSLDDALHQRVVRVTNRWTFEGATFNSLRARRPGAGAAQQTPVIPPEVIARIEAQQGSDDFCNPKERTTADTFGRLSGTYLQTASNVAKVDGWHGLLIFQDHDPLAIDAPLVEEMLTIAHQWAQQVHAADAAARHFFLAWNCLWRAGASQVHGHAHMTLSQIMAHARVELLRAAAGRYRRETGADYFNDLAAAHAALGLAASVGPVMRFASLTPIKEREVILLLPAAAAPGASWGEWLRMLAGPLAETLRVARERLGTLAFNVAIFGPPLDASAQPDQDWRDFPFVARFVDRGDPNSQTSDIAALELFGSSSISSDPFVVASVLHLTEPLATVRAGKGAASLPA